MGRVRRPRYLCFFCDDFPFLDIGLLYYRTDLLQAHGVQPPRTWEELTRMADPDITRRLCGIPGVAQVDLVGGIERARTGTRPGVVLQTEQTLTDTNVRDTWELTPDQVTLAGPGWAALMDRALEHFRDELGLPPRARLRAELHSMLVYGKGQFFLPIRTRRKTTRWWARWWCRCRRRTPVGN